MICLPFAAVHMWNKLVLKCRQLSRHVQCPRNTAWCRRLLVCLWTQHSRFPAYCTEAISASGCTCWTFRPVSSLSAAALPARYLAIFLERVVWRDKEVHSFTHVVEAESSSTFLSCPGVWCLPPSCLCWWVERLKSMNKHSMLACGVPPSCGY